MVELSCYHLGRCGAVVAPCECEAHDTNWPHVCEMTFTDSDL